MRIKNIIPLLLVFLLAACIQPFDPGTAEVKPAQSDQDSSQGEQILVIENDTSRSQGVYVNERGIRFDIVSTEDESGISCTEAVDIALVKDSDSIKAVIVGVRNDGKPGIWIVYPDDTIGVAEMDGKTSSALPDSDDHNDSFRGPFGWQYYVTGISEDAKMIIGYVIHVRGFSHGRWQTDPGTTVGVYWKGDYFDHSQRFRLFGARIIGTPDPLIPEEYSGLRYLKYLYSYLKLFFLDWFENYLTTAEEVAYDFNSESYHIYGPDKEEISSVATIHDWRVESIEPVANGENKPPSGTFAEADFYVFNGGTDDVNGLFEENGTTGNILNGPKYEKVSGAYYALYQFGNSAGYPTWAIHTGTVSYPTPVADVTYYVEDPSSVPPDSGWFTGNPGTDPAPAVHSYPVHIRKENGVNILYTTFIYYEYSDPEGDPEGKTQYLWYRSATGVTDWDLVAEGTDNFYETTDGSGFLMVEIVPIDANGKEGATIQSGSVEIDPS
jgi:hypothetical protein